MIFNKHSYLVGQHALLSASKPSWVNYDDEQLDQYFYRTEAARRGTELHEFAAQAIRLRQRLPRNEKTINQYVNDAIGYRMTPEQVLFYSINCFGTADAISFWNNILRISDLKNGLGRVTVKQLEVYAAIFCLEYKVKPHEIAIELRIYQNDAVSRFDPDSEVILHIMNKIVAFDKRLNARREELL